MSGKFSLAFATVAALALLTLAVSDSQAKPANGFVIRDQAARLTTQQVGYMNNVGQYRSIALGGDASEVGVPEAIIGCLQRRLVIAGDTLLNSSRG
jgi:hypothetical protein